MESENNDLSIVDIIVDGFDDLLDLDAESKDTIAAVVESTEKELQDCEDIATFMEESNKTIQTSLIPAIDHRINEIERLFSAVEAMEKRVIPSLNSDLDLIENILENIEKKTVKAQSPLTFSTLWEKLQFPSPSKQEKTRQSSSSNIEETIPSDFPIHSQELILDEVISAIPEKQ